jgi:hypothetical protein
MDPRVLGSFSELAQNTEKISQQRHHSRTLPIGLDSVCPDAVHDVGRRSERGAAGKSKILRSLTSLLQGEKVDL